MLRDDWARGELYEKAREMYVQRFERLEDVLQWAARTVAYVGIRAGEEAGVEEEKMKIIREKMLKVASDN